MPTIELKKEMTNATNGGNQIQVCTSETGNEMVIQAAIHAPTEKRRHTRCVGCAAGTNYPRILPIIES